MIPSPRRFTAGAHCVLPTRTALQPYVIGSGVATLGPAPKVRVNGEDITPVLLAEDAFKTPFADQNHPSPGLGYQF